MRNLTWYSFFIRRPSGAILCRLMEEYCHSLFVKDNGNPNFNAALRETINAVRKLRKFM